MRVEARGDHDEVRLKRVEPRQDRHLEGLAKLPAAVAGRQRRVDDGVVGAALRARAGAGIKRHFVGRAIHHARIRPEDFLAAVAVVHVEIDDGDALGAVLRLRVAGGDGGVVEETKAHGGRGLGVMAGRAHGDEGVTRVAAHHLIDGVRGAARRAQDRLPASVRERGVGVDARELPFRRYGVVNRVEIGGRMHALHRLGVDALGGLALERGKVAVAEHLFDGADAIRPLGMAGRRVVAEARFVGVQKRGH